ncbi:MAG: ABC transporter permease [Oscillospiraceae bacterium]|jgi:ribose transport system permease protein|nr:ABC transporter permease [Oscillospiraceae bacterium]
MKSFIKSKGMTLLIVTAIVFIFFTVMNRKYVSWNNLRGIMYSMSLTGTITCGMACLMMSGSIDLASGAEGMMGGVLLAYMLRAGMAWPLALLVALLAGCFFGLINAFLSNVLNFMPFIATIAMASVYQGIAGAMTKNQPVMITNQSFWTLGSTNVWIFPLPFVIMVLLLVIYGIIISSTKFGRQVLYCGGNRMAARLAGMNYKKITTIMFVNNGAIAVLGGSILAARLHNGSQSSVIGSEMDGMTAAIIGGVSFLGGGSSGMPVLFIGILMLNCFKNGLYIINLDAYWQVVSNGALLILALIVDFFREKRRIRALKLPAAGGKAA